MRIRFRQSGGFAGLLRGCDVDCTDLPPDAAAALAALRARRPAPRPGGADRLQFEITVTNDGGTSDHIALGESAIPDDVRPLITFLQSRSGPVAP